MHVSSLSAEPRSHVNNRAMVDVLFMQSQAYFGSDSMIHSLIMRELDRSRFRVHVACNRGSGGRKSASLAALEQIPGLIVRPTDFGPTVNARSHGQIASDLARTGPGAVIDLAGLVRYARRNRIAIVHGTEKPRDAFYGLLLARAVGARAVTHLHVGIEDWISPLTRWAMARDDGLIAVSQFVAATAIAKGYSAERTSWVLNGVDASRWDPDTDGRPLRRELGLPEEIPVISIISRLFPWKGHGILLEALAKVKADGLPFKLLVAGEDDPRATPGGGSYLAQIRNQAEGLGLADDVVFTGFRRDVEALLAATDIYAMPSFEEPCAVAFLEAMAMARPVVALASGGTPQLVEHGRSGLLSAPDDIDALAANVAGLLRHPEARRRMGRAARRDVEGFFTPRRLAADVEAIYDRLLDRRPIGGPRTW